MTEPFSLFSTWFSAAAAEPRVREAMQLATVGADGRPSLRTVLLKGHGPAGFVFYTNNESRKGNELAADRRVAALLHWKSLERQVIVEGDVAPVAAEDADAYFATRDRGSQLGAWASAQSLLDDGELAARVAAFAARFPDAVPRPPHWGGWLIRPSRIEFWQGRPDRLHERREFVRAGEGWIVRILQP